jgi:hypothetical protein
MDRPDGTPGDEAPVIQIELRLDGTIPAGVARGPGGAARDFCGWIGMMSAVDAVAGAREDELIEEG